MADLPGTNTPNPPPLVPSVTPTPPLVPANWVPDKTVAMAFTNYLWAAGYQKQAVAYWDAYCKAAGILE